MSKGQQLQAIRGMNDILPTQVRAWQKLETTIRQLMHSYGMQEIRTPLLEKTALFKRGIGDVTDIVEKEMYTFEDRSGDSLSLRPEGTASCVRACMEHGMLYHQTQRLWYYGPMYRHERPQKDRYRQFYQLGVEMMGMSEPEVDAELILLGERLWRELGIDQQIELQINSLGSKESRKLYREHLVRYFSQHQNQLDEDSQRRLKTNPLRILDSKNPEMQQLIAKAPRLLDHLDEHSQAHFDRVQAILQAAGVKYVINPRLVRGLDYYNDTAFEWVTSQLGAQGTVCGGGRYDDLVEVLGGPATPAVGFAMGVERVLGLLQQSPEWAASLTPVDVYVIYQGEAASLQSLILMEKWRDQLPQIGFLRDNGAGKMAAMLKRADKSGARFAVILGEQEMAQDQVTVKFLRESKPQQTIAQSDLRQFLHPYVTTLEE